MKIETKQIVEIVGAGSIVASLIFVGVQLQQDRVVSLGAQLNNRAENGLETFALQFENEAWINEIVERKKQGLEWTWWNDDIQEYQDRYKVSDEGMYRLYLRARMAVISFDNNFYQHQLGLIDDDTWASVRNSNKEYLRSAINRSVYENSMGMRMPAKAMIMEMLAEIDMETTN